MGNARPAFNPFSFISFREQSSNFSLKEKGIVFRLTPYSQSSQSQKFTKPWFLSEYLQQLSNEAQSAHRERQGNQLHHKLKRTVYSELQLPGIKVPLTPNLRAAYHVYTQF